MNLTFDEYQKQAITTDTYGGGVQPVSSEAFITKLLGLCGESGEFANKVKKLFRDKHGAITAEDKAEILKELGDVLWYLSVLTTYLGEDLEKVAQANLDKLFDRKNRDAIKGRGDNR